MMRGRLFCSVAVAAAVLAGCTTTAASPTTLTAVPTISSTESSQLSAAAASTAVLPSSTRRTLVSRLIASPTPTPTGSVSTSAGASSKTAKTANSTARSTEPAHASVESVVTTTSPVNLGQGRADDLTVRERADRAAIENSWIRFWEVTSRLIKTPSAQRLKLLASVAIEPQVGKLLAAAQDFDAHGWDQYGTVGHRFYWGPPVDGGGIAILGDCMDFSRAGRLDVKSGKALTVGVTRSNIRGTFTRGAGDTWRVNGVQILENSKC